MFKFAAVLITVTFALGTVGFAEVPVQNQTLTVPTSGGIQVGSGDQAL